MMKTFKLLLIKAALLSTIAIPSGVLVVGTAHADSCWNHNGSLVRIKASGNKRLIYYETPRAALQKAGVRRGTLLFNGTKNGNWYSGIARRFSKFCPGSPLKYSVAGPVRGDQLQIVVRGKRDVFKQCKLTGKIASDELVFTYVKNC